MSLSSRVEPDGPVSVAGRPGRALSTAVLLAAAVGCHPSMSVFDTAGEGAARIAGTTWFIMVLAAVVYIGVLVMLLVAVRRRGASLASPATVPVDLAPRSQQPVIVGGAILPAMILAAVFVVSLGAMGWFPAKDEESPLLTIVGHQWWWDVRYEDPGLTRSFRTANELHVPVGRVVRLRLVSADVIHSFWVPQLQGKIDLVPGDTNEVRILATREGRFRGQCAEYCGSQHAHMAFTVIAESPEAFGAWLAAQRAAAREPDATDVRMTLGRTLVTTGPCALCHSIRGTEAQGQIAPDLTHVGSRVTLAAGALPNTLGTMEAWITNAQALKPGARMPSLTQFSGRELVAIATYLESLK